MIPLRDENPTRRFPWLTLLLIASNVAAFVYMVFVVTEPELFVQRYGFQPARFLADPASPMQILTVFTSMFLHAGWIHLGGNMLYLWIFGNNLEDRLGRFGFLGFYLTGGVVAVAAQAAVNPASSIPNVGASGAIAAILGGYVLLYPRAAVLTVIPIFFFIEVARIPAAFVIGFWFVLQLANGLASVAPGTAQAAGVAWFAHIGGFVAGAVLILPVWLAGRNGSSRFRGYG